MRTLVLAVLAVAVPAEANEWHAGLNLRSELGTHPIRLDGGVRLGRLDLIGVVDPMFWTDGEVDVDAIAAWHIGDRGYAVFTGWRPASIAIGEDRQWQHGVLLGALGPLPRIGPLDLAWGFEVATVVFTHGGPVPADMLSLDSMSTIGDSVNVSMFLRIGVGDAL